MRTVSPSFANTSPPNPLARPSWPSTERALLYTGNYPNSPRRRKRRFRLPDAVGPPQSRSSKDNGFSKTSSRARRKTGRRPEASSTRRYGYRFDPQKKNFCTPLWKNPEAKRHGRPMRASIEIEDFSAPLQRNDIMKNCIVDRIKRILSQNTTMLRWEATSGSFVPLI